MKRILSVMVTALMSALLLAVLAPPASAHVPPPHVHAPRAAAPPAPTAGKAQFPATGARAVVLDKRTRTAFLVNPDGTVSRKIPVIHGGRLTPPGRFVVSQEMAVNYDKTKGGAAGIWRLDDFTRFNGGIGFHRVPVNKFTGVPMHSDGALGRSGLASHGCVRVSAADAKVLQAFVKRGTVVTVLERL